MTGAGSKNKKGGSRLPAFHPNLFTYVVTCGPAAAVPPSYVALGRACVEEDPLQRPTFDEILSALEVVRRDAERRIAETAATAAAAVLMKQRIGSGWFRSNALDGVMDGGLGSGGLGQQVQGGEAASAAGVVIPTLAPECMLRGSLDVVIAARPAGAQPADSDLGDGRGLGDALGNELGSGSEGSLGNSTLTGGVLCSVSQADMPLDGGLVDRGNG